MLIFGYYETKKYVLLTQKEQLKFLYMKKFQDDYKLILKIILLSEKF